MSQDRDADRFPPCVPPHVRAGLKLRKLYRQSATRWQERQAAHHPFDALLADGEPDRLLVAEAPNPLHAVNKCGRWYLEDLDRPEIAPIAQRMEALKAALTSRGLRYTNTAGNFLAREFHPVHERGKLWENAWVIRHSDVRPGQVVLDVGGASTIFSFYLASLGCRVTVVDNDWANCGTLYNANYVARAMGWDLRALDRDISQPLPFADGSLDRVFSVCVIEHLPPGLRQFLLREIGRILRPGGLAGFTTDYDATRPVLVTDKGLRFAYWSKFERDVIHPSGLQVHGAADWTDACAADTFLGAFFLRKPDTAIPAPVAH